MRILIGYDGSDCAKRALNDLRNAGLPKVAEVLVLSAVDVFLPQTGKGSEEMEMFPIETPQAVKFARERAIEAFKHCEAMASDAAVKVREMFPEWKVTPIATAESPHWAIILKSKEWKSDLIVVGSHGRSAIGRAIFGSVAQKVLYETDCSVRIARGTHSESTVFQQLVLGIDGSPDSDAMVDVVAARKWREGSKALIVTAIESFHRYDVEFDIEMNRIREIQEIATKKLAASGLEVSTIITEEDPKDYLLNKAEELQADCIFLGAQGHSFLDRLLLGSISSSVAARAESSVEIVRRSAK